MSVNRSSHAHIDSRAVPSRAPIVARGAPSSVARSTSAPGNQAVQRLRAAGIQTKLTVSQPEDPAEREAERMADKVMRMPAPLLQRSGCPTCAEGGAPCASCRSESTSKVQRQVDASATRGSIDLGGQQLELGASESLDPGTRAFFEPRFGQDFSGVRIHTDARAAASAQQLEALAFTVGSDIVFAADAYAPQTSAGRHLLAHELTHVVQQSAVPSASVQRRAEIGERPPQSELYFDGLAEELFEAMDIVGTDEEAVYNALQQLNGDPAAIAMLMQRYTARYRRDLVVDIRDEFSEEELEYALQLLLLGDRNAAQAIVPMPSADLSVEVKRLDAAMDRIGTDEEAIYAVLLPFNRATQGLEAAYQTTVGRSLRADILEEMSEEELDYALSLLSFDAAYFIERYFEPPQRLFARKILDDILAVTDRLSFRDDAELATEIIVRLRTSQLMQETQQTTAFGYPETCSQDDCPGSCIGRGSPNTPGYIPPDINFNARVNLDARDYWVRGPQENGFYLFLLSREGFRDPFAALTKLFTPQRSICDQTLIHCDYLTTVIHLRAFAESIGAGEFNRRVQRSEISMRLSYQGFADIELGTARAARGISLQSVVPGSEADLLIGDHVIFWNHLAYDALTASSTWSGPWRLENALVVDKDASGADLFEGHGAPAPGNVVRPGNRELMLSDLADAFNGPAARALELTAKVDAGEAGATTQLQVEFPQLLRGADGHWWIAEVPRNFAWRGMRYYPLRELSGPGDPELPGLRDPFNPGRMSPVKRPIESAPGTSPRRPPRR